MKDSGVPFPAGTTDGLILMHQHSHPRRYVRFSVNHLPTGLSSGSDAGISPRTRGITVRLRSCITVYSVYHRSPRLSTARPGTGSPDLHCTTISSVQSRRNCCTTDGLTPADCQVRPVFSARQDPWESSCRRKRQDFVSYPYPFLSIQ